MWAASQRGCKDHSAAEITTAQLAEPPAARARSVSAVRVEPAALDFGTVARGTRMERTVKLMNSTPRAITVREVKSSCGCTVAKLNSKTIEPNGSIELSVALSAAGRSNAPINKRVSIVFEGDVDSIHIPVEAVIAQDLVGEHADSRAATTTFGVSGVETTSRGRTISVTPRRLRFDALGPGGSSTRIVRLHGAPLCPTCAPVVVNSELESLIAIQGWHREANGDVAIELVLTSPYAATDRGTRVDLPNGESGPVQNVWNEVEITFGNAAATLVVYARFGAADEHAE